MQTKVVFSILFTLLICCTQVRADEPGLVQLSPQSQAKFRLGSVNLGSTSRTIQESLGAPESKGSRSLEEATGLWIQNWNYPQRGLTIEFSQTSPLTPPEVYRIRAVAPCQLEGIGGAKIGMSTSELFTLLGRAKADFGGQPQFSDGGYFGIFWEQEYIIMSFSVDHNNVVSEIYLLPGPE